MAEKAHHEYGPSTLDNLALCVRFEYDDSDALAAVEGTDLHLAFETGDLAGLDEEQARSVSAIRNYVDSLKFEDGSNPDEWLDWKECELELAGLTFGTADRVLFNKRMRLAHIIDAKFGRVDKDHGLQVKTYGAAFVEMHPELEIDTVVTHIAAPRIGPVERMTHSAGILVSDTRGFITELYARIANPFTPPTPHEDICGKCARASSCPALGKAVVKTAEGMGLPLPSVFAPDAMTCGRDRSIGHCLAGIFENWAKQVKRGNAAYVEAGGTVPGFRLTRRSSGLYVPKDRTKAAIEAVGDAGLGTTIEDVLGCCSLVVGDLVAAVALRKGVPEKTAKEMVRQALAEHASEGFSTFLSKEKRVADETLLGQVVSGSLGE